MKKRAFIALAVFIFCLAVSARAEREVLYFYRSYCESCRPEDDFAANFRSLTGTGLETCDFSAYNVALGEGEAAYEAAVVKYGVESPALPLAIVDGVPYAGAGEMDEGLARAALEWGGDGRSVIVYLYSPACESCARAEAVIEALPDEVTVKRGNLGISSRVSVERVDISAEPGLAQALFEAYEVPENRRIAPCVFLSERYLSGIADIEKNLADMVRLGWAAGGVKSVARTNGASESLSFAGAVLAGLAAGVNTCAMSMFLLFMSIALRSGRRAGMLSACFLISKFACYLLIGFLLIGVMQRFNPGWFRPVARIVLTALGGFFVLLNVRDFFKALGGRYGEIRNQLPAPLRSRLSARIKRLSLGRFAFISVIALGFVVAAGEFLCAGQIYLMQLIALARSGEGGAAFLIAYCLAFVMPSAVICLALLLGRSQARLSVFFLKNMPWVKLISSAVMLAIIVAAWL